MSVSHFTAVYDACVRERKRGVAWPPKLPGRRNESFTYWLPEREEDFDDLEWEPIAELPPLRYEHYGRRKGKG